MVFQEVFQTPLPDWWSCLRAKHRRASICCLCASSATTHAASICCITACCCSSHTACRCITIQYPYNNHACYDFSMDTLRLNSTHPDTYNLVGLSECLHLWWIPLLTLELLTPELCVTSVTMDQFSLTTRLVHSEFQASYYSHHKSQSALGETN